LKDSLDALINPSRLTDDRSFDTTNLSNNFNSTAIG
jgi:hypothetical protein